MTTDRPLYVAFLWHMHQPFYKNPFTGIYRLPWVRLHGTKDYLDMALILDDYPDIRQTFNLVPSLIEQLLDYTDNKTTDAFLDVTFKKASDLKDSEKIFILENFFLANWENMIKPFPRYQDLLLKRGLSFSRTGLQETVKYLTESDFLDLQVLFNLAWIDPYLRSRDEFLSQLEKKGKDYSEEEKSLLIARQYSMLQSIIPKYRELSKKGQIEISTSPFYHPILPLLCDTDVAGISNPHTKLPAQRFSHPEDSKAQITRAIAYFEKIFGCKPAGMWPSEGSVSEETIKTMHAAGIKWLATDEDILAGSLKENLRTPSGETAQPSRLYTDYSFAGTSIIFRDRRLSDLIGFTYSGWNPKNAANDFINRLLHIQGSVRSNEPHIVPVILDGENAWEYYKNDGHDFLRYLYEGLSCNSRLKTTTISDYLREHSAGKKLDHIHPGSWIYANFNIWIGHEEDNAAWDYLNRTRKDLEAADPGKNLEPAWKALYVAEGSDWNWWYGDDHSTDSAADFDELFRLNLMKTYTETGREIPVYLYESILKEDRVVAPSMGIRGFINPKIDGIMTSYFEWYHAGLIDAGKSGGSMHLSESLISKVYYGFSKDTLFVRVDPKSAFSVFPEDAALVINIVRPNHFRVCISLNNANHQAKLYRRCDSEWSVAGEITRVSVVDILECAIPFQDIEAKEHDELNLFLTVRKGNEDMERCPWRGYITVSVPTPDFEAIMWS